MSVLTNVLTACNDSHMNNNEIREAVRQMLNDWNDATDEQRAAALAAVA